MPKFFYTARTLAGEAESGVRDAKSEQELARLLRAEGLLLISAKESKEALRTPFSAYFKKFAENLPVFGRVGLKEKIFFARNLRIMVSAGISLPRALTILSEQTRNKKFKTALLDIAQNITKGASFSGAIAPYPAIFPELFQNMIKVGEEAGTLDQVLKVLAEQMEKEQELKSKITSALIYPSVIVLAMILIGIIMLIVVVPQLAKTFKELEIELPATTRFVIFLGTFLAQKWYLAILIVFIFLIFFRIILKSKGGQKTRAYLLLKIPLLSDLVKKTNSAAMARTLASLIMAGVPIVKSLEIISRTLTNPYYQKALQDSAEKVRKGQKIAQTLKLYQNLYPSLVWEMIQIGEETGETSEILVKLANFYEEEVARITKNLSSVIEPLLMLFIGAVVGFFAISMVQPMYAMLQAIK